MMFISEDNISLRVAEPEDAVQIYDWENDRAVWRISETSTPPSLFQVEQFLLGNSDLVANRQLRLMIEAAGHEKPVGCIDLFDYNPLHGRVGIGVLVEEPCRRNGYAYRAIKLCLQYLFEDVMVHQVHCLIDELNEESLRLFEKLGFTRCGSRKDWIKTPQGYVDVCFYQIIAHETETE
ncbi:MAG: GNAT family N-acetyltransferase [Bacteroidales bacterium]|nr:GNAT family N-acetyltransferase [Bacteroidales bacterium]